MALGQIDPYYVEDSGRTNFEDMASENGDNVDNYDVHTRDYFLLLPPRYLGYSAQEKFWGQFKVEATSNVSKARASIFEDQLQLDPKYKDMIQALVVSHQSKNSSKGDKPEVRDFVEDKGKGLVILLHGMVSASAIQEDLSLIIRMLGPPGVGKTVNPSLCYVMLSSSDCLTFSNCSSRQRL
jgi:hypothetical protein